MFSLIICSFITQQDINGFSVCSRCFSSWERRTVSWPSCTSTTMPPWSSTGGRGWNTLQVASVSTRWSKSTLRPVDDMMLTVTVCVGPQPSWLVWSTPWSTWWCTCTTALQPWDPTCPDTCGGNVTSHLYSWSVLHSVRHVTVCVYVTVCVCVRMKHIRIQKRLIFSRMTFNTFGWVWHRAAATFNTFHHFSLKHGGNTGYVPIQS